MVLKSWLMESPGCSQGLDQVGGGGRRGADSCAQGETKVKMKSEIG